MQATLRVPRVTWLPPMPAGVLDGHHAVDHLLRDEVMLASQMPRAQTLLVGAERQLWAAVLEDAVRCCTHRPTALDHLHSKGRAERNARAWIASDAARPASFLWICAVLGLEPDAVRERLASVAPVAAGTPRLGAEHRGMTLRRGRPACVNLHLQPRGRPDGWKRPNAAQRVARAG